ncbi:hypothetical protein RclHR1_02890015 [Rhizophagus clarus]|uniref:Uncharacterized protein n=1 Tax=Rhizophagus clarus TaxID=94130 RepID=A0A2Z6QUV0_9GLOM|nr:hypothetical protein RclHR1_19900003 [Rhizophagus clarus]GBB96988.1 hypothetical protein RclHR1_02890015 [Rhizophagus clarus]
MSSRNNYSNNSDVFDSNSANRFDQANITNDTYNNQQPMLDSNVISPDPNHHASDSIYHHPIPTNVTAPNNNDNISPNSDQRYDSEPTRNFQSNVNIPPQQLYQQHGGQNPLQSNTFHINSPQTFILNISTTNSDTLQQIYGFYCSTSKNNPSQPQ